MENYGPIYIENKFLFQIHRNCLHDDSFGVDEALNEQAFGKGLVVRGSHYLVLGPYLKSSQGKSKTSPIL